MKLRLALLSTMAMAIASCTTTAGLSGDPLSKRWVGTEAGKFFAAYGPPQTDEETGSSTTYVWKGGYRTRKVEAEYKGEGDNKKMVKRAGTRYLSCSVRLVVGSDYMIKSITKIVDKPGVNGGPTWCEEVLDAAKS